MSAYDRSGKELELKSSSLQRPDSVEFVQEIVKDLLVETQHMHAANMTLSRQLQTSTQEVLSLTERLERVQAEASNDALTGLLNRRGFEKAIAALPNSGRGLQGASLLALDLDGFKQINDTHGHLCGDEVLRAIAQLLRARTRGSDIPARLGGDEFVVFLPDTAEAGAVALAEQIRTTLVAGRLRRSQTEQPVENVTLSVGVAEARANDLLETLMQRADSALYGAKRSGRNQVYSATNQT